MRLERFELRGFAQHSVLEVTFREYEPNLIVGPNEAGKSHLMTALTGTLFGIQQPELYEPWHGSREMTGCLQFVVGADRVTIKRRFLDQDVKVTINGDTLYHGRGLPYGRGRGLNAEDEKYKALLNEWVGFTEPEVFQRTVFVEQDLLIDNELGRFSSQIKRLVSGTHEANYETAIEELESELDKLVKLPGKRANRRHENLLEQLDDVERQRDAAEQVQEEVVALTEEAESLQRWAQDAKSTRERNQKIVDSYSELQRQIAAENQARINWSDLEAQIERLLKLQEQRSELEQKRDSARIPRDLSPSDISSLEREIERLETKVERLQEAAQRNQEIAKRRAELESLLKEYQIPDEVDPDELRRLDRQVQQLEWELHDLTRKRDELVSSGLRKTFGVLNPTVVRIVTVAIALATFAGSVELLGQSLLVGIVLGISVVAAGFFLTRDWAAEHKQIKAAYAGELAQLDSAIERSTKTRSDTALRRNQLFGAMGAWSLDELNERLSNYQQTLARLEAQPEVDETPGRDLEVASDELRTAQQRRDEALEAADEDTLDALHARAVEYQETLRLLEQLPELKPEELVSLNERRNTEQQNTVIAAQRKEELLEEHPELHDISAEQIASCRELVERALRDEANAARRLQEVKLERRHLARGSADAEVLRAEATRIRAEIGRVEQLVEAHQIAIDALKTAAMEFQERALDPIGNRAGVLLSRITEDRYRSVVLDRDSMIPTVSANGFANIPMSRLSRGARDQLFLSIRAALIDALSDDRNLPMVLDDPCVNFDEERLGKTAKVIAELAKERQILLFTKDETWTLWFDPVLRLERSDASTPVS